MKIRNTKIKKIQNFLYLVGIFLIYFFLIDFALTKGLKLKNIVNFFEGNEKNSYLFKPLSKMRIVGPFDNSLHFSTTDKFNNKTHLAKEACPNKYNLEKNKVSEISYNGIIVGDEKLSSLELKDEKNYIYIINQDCNNRLSFVNGGVNFYDVSASLSNLQRLIDIYKLRTEILDYKILMLSINDFYKKKDYDRNFLINYFNKKSYLSNDENNKIINLGYFFIDYFRKSFSITYRFFYDLRKNLSQVKIYNNHKFKKNLSCKITIQTVKNKIETGKFSKIIIGVHPEIDKKSFSFINTLKMEKCLRNHTHYYDSIEILPLYETSKMILEEEYNNHNFSYSDYKDKEHEIIAKSLIKLLDN